MRKGNRKGSTMVELVVTFALIVLFSLGTMQMVAVSLRTYNQIRELNQVRQVSDTLMDKITGELEGAQVGMSVMQDNDFTLCIRADGTQVHFYDRKGSPICLTSKNQRLEIIYKAVDDYEEVNWGYDEKVYMGYQIESLRFSQPDLEVYPPNIIKAELELSKGGEQTFSTVRYVECSNFDSEQDFGRIWDESKPQPKISDAS